MCWMMISSHCLYYSIAKKYPGEFSNPKRLAFNGACRKPEANGELLYYPILAGGALYGGETERGCHRIVFSVPPDRPPSFCGLITHDGPQCKGEFIPCEPKMQASESGQKGPTGNKGGGGWEGQATKMSSLQQITKDMLHGGTSWFASSFSWLTQQIPGVLLPFPKGTPDSGRSRKPTPQRNLPGFWGGGKHYRYRYR